MLPHYKIKTCSEDKNADKNWLMFMLQKLTYFGHAKRDGKSNKRGNGCRLVEWIFRMALKNQLQTAEHKFAW